MYTACIALVDASRARLFTFARSNDSGELTEDLAEQRDLINPARRLRPSQLFTETRPPSGRTGRLQYGLDDHRDEHIAAMDTAFSRTIIDEVADLIRSAKARRLIVCASPNMLGELRRGRESLPEDIVIDEIPRNFVKLTRSQLRGRLASYGLLPAVPARA